MAFLQELKDAFNPNKPSKFKRLREQPAAELPDAYESKMEDLPAHVRKDVRRYLHIFNNDIGRDLIGGVFPSDQKCASRCVDCIVRVFPTNQESVS